MTFLLKGVLKVQLKMDETLQKGPRGEAGLQFGALFDVE